MIKKIYGWRKKGFGIRDWGLGYEGEISLLLIQTDKICSKKYIVKLFYTEFVFQITIFNEITMNLWGSRFHLIDRKLTKWMAGVGILLLRVSIGIIFTWFGVLKFFPGISPAEDLAVRTLEVLTFGLINPQLALIILAAWETIIGLGLITGLFLREILLLLFLQMIGTISPVFIFPEEVFRIIPFVPTLEGQYIFKNLVLVSAGIVIGATVRGGQLISEPVRKK